MAEQKIARYISIAFHGIFLPWVGWFLIFRHHLVLRTSLTTETYWYLLGVFAVTFLFIPLAVSMFLMRSRKVKVLENANNNQRQQILAFSAFYFGSMGFTLGNLFFVDFMKFYLWGITFSAAVAALLYFKWRVSLHTMAWGGLCATTYFLQNHASKYLSILFIILLILAGIVGYSRLKLQAHKPLEIYLGYAVGITTQIIAYTLIYGI